MMARVATLLALSLALVAAPALAAPFAYVPNSFSNDVSVIDAATNTVVKTVPVGSRPLGVAVAIDDTRVYVTNFGSASVSVIDTERYTVTTISVGDGPYGVAIHPSGTRIYVANQLSNSVSVIDTASNAVVATVPVGMRPTGVVVYPDGSRVYVTNHGSETVSVIDTADNTEMG